MIALPRYAVAPATFRFRALATLADKLPLGGEREVALVTWMAARLAWHLGDSPGVDPAVRARAAAARQWGQSLSLPAPVRTAWHQLLDAVSRNDRGEAASAWSRLLTLAPRVVETALRSEARQLDARLAGRPLPVTDA